MKRGSLSISTNAIVVLIVAVLMLGLILAFVNDMFSAVSTDFREQIAQEKEPNPPSTNNPITLSSVSKAGDPGSRLGINVKIRNTDPLADGLEIQPFLECVGDNANSRATQSLTLNSVTEDREVITGAYTSLSIEGSGNSPKSEVFPQVVDFQGVGDYTYDFFIRDAAEPKTYLCRMLAVAQNGNQQFITSMKGEEFRIIVEG